MGCPDHFSPHDNRIHLIDLGNRSRAARRRFRYWIYRSWGFHCAYCGEDLKHHRQSCTLDHVIPRHRNGPSETWNLVLACSRCNSSKSNKDMLGWFSATPFFLEIRLARIERWQREHYQQWQRWN